MGLAYGSAAALCWGLADFVARSAGARVGALRTVLYAQGIALLCLLALGDWHRAFAPAALPALALGAVLGLLYTAGSVLLYYALSSGRLAVVSPISSSFAAVTLALSLLSGATMSAARLAGLLLTLIGVVIVARPPEEQGGATTAGRLRGVAAALGAAVLFGVTLWAYQFVVPALGLWTPVLERNLMALIVIPLVALPLRQSIAVPPRATWALLIAVGVIDTCGTAAYNRGLATDIPGVVAVLGSLFSAVTILLAYLFLRERLSRQQWAGVAVILCAIILIGLGAQGVGA